MFWLEMAVAAPLLNVVAAPVDIEVQYLAFQQSNGSVPPLACERVRRDLPFPLCLRSTLDHKVRWATMEDIAPLRVVNKINELSKDEKVVWTAKIIEGGGDYWLAEEKIDAVTVILHPHELDVLGLPVRVAFPAEGVVLAWKPGNQDVDRILAVAVSEMYQSSEIPVTDVVYIWDGTAFRPWVAAVPK